MDAMVHDKKAEGASVHIILVEEIGRAVQKTVDIGELRRLLEEGFR